MGMRILAILAIVALSWFGQPAFAHADATMPAAQALAEASEVFDWMLFYLHIKLVLVLLIVAAIAGLAHLAQRRQHSPDGELVPVRIR